MATAPLRDRIRAEYSTLLDNFTNLLRSARLPDEAGELGSRPQGRVPGELMEVFAEKMLQACHALLGVIAELKRNALLNDVAGRNAEVASSGVSLEEEAAQLQQQFLHLQQQIDAAMQLVPPLEGGPQGEEWQQAQGQQQQLHLLHQQQQQQAQGQLLQQPQEQPLHQSDAELEFMDI